MAGETKFLCRFGDCTRRKIQVNLVDNLTKMTLHVGHNDRLGQLFSISLIPSVVLDLDVQIEGAFTAVNFLAVFVRANLVSVNVARRPANMFLPIVVLFGA